MQSHLELLHMRFIVIAFDFGELTSNLLIGMLSSGEHEKRKVLELYIQLYSLKRDVT